MRIRPPIYFLAAIALQFLAREDFPLVTWTGAGWGPLALTLGLATVGWIFWALWCFRSARTPVDPFAQPSALIERGPYRLSRNPIYLGMVLLLFAAAIKGQALSPFLVPPLFAFVIGRRFIAGEESKLAAAFGPRYDRYRSSVGRWFGRG